MPNNSNFSIGKIQSLVDKLFKLFSNFIDGYDVKDSNVAKESGGVRSTLVLKGEGPEGADLRVDLIATNVGSVFKEITSDIRGLTALGVIKEPEEQDDDDYADDIAQGLADYDASVEISDNPIYGAATLSKEAVDVLKLLLGANCVEKQDDIGNITYTGDITLDTAIKNGSGILGIDLAKVATKGKLNSKEFDWWRIKAFDQLRYTLVCEAGNYDAGKVSNAKLTDCVTWITKYTNIISGKSSEEGESKQQTREDKLNQSRNINTSALLLVTPILEVIQQELRKIYQDRLNSEASELDKLIPGNEPQEGEDTSTFDETALQETEEAAEQAAQSQQTGDGTTATQHIGITLKKIQASDELAILRLASDYNPSDTLSDVDEIINQEEFLNTLTEEPQAFDIAVDEDGFDVEPCETCPECSPCESLCEVFKAGIRAYRNLYILHWMSHGNDMMKLHNLSEEMYEELQGEIDTIGELLVEKQGTVPQLDFACDYIPVQQYDFQTGLDQIKSLIQMYIDCIDYAYCNQDSDVQSTLDEWLRYWNKQLNYFVKGQEI